MKSTLHILVKDEEIILCLRLPIVIFAFLGFSFIPQRMVVFWEFSRRANGWHYAF